jgi:hypothetical protein
MQAGIRHTYKPYHYNNHPMIEGAATSRRSPKIHQERTESHNMEINDGNSSYIWQQYSTAADVLHGWSDSIGAAHNILHWNSRNMTL